MKLSPKNLFLILPMLLITVSFVTAQRVDRTKEALELFKEKKYHAAKEILLAEVAEGNKDEKVLLALLRVHMLGEDFVQARKIIEEQKNLLRLSSVAQDYAAILIEKGEWAEGEKYLGRSDRNGGYYALLLRVLENKNDVASMRPILQYQKNTLPEETYRKFLTLVLGDTEKQIEAARKEGDLARAASLCKEYLLLEKTAAFQLLLASIQYGRGDFDQTLSLLRDIKVADLKDPYPFTFYKLEGMTFNRKRRLDDSLTSLKKAEGLNGTDFDVLYYLADSHYRSKLYSAAESYSLKAIQTKPSKEAYYLRSLIFVDQNRYAEALEPLGKYLEKAPEDSKMRETFQRVKGFVLFDEGNALYQKKNFVEAALKFEKAMETFPPPVNPVVKIMLANSWYSEGQRVPAKQDDLFTKAEVLVRPLANEPSLLSQVYDLLFNVYTQKKQFDKSGELTGLRQKSLSNVDDQYYADVAYQFELQKKYDGAVSNYEKAYKMRSTGETKRKLILSLGNWATEKMNAGLFPLAKEILDRADKVSSKEPLIVKLRLTLRGLEEREALLLKMAEAEKAYTKKNYSEALALYQEIEKLNPDLTDLTSSFASTLYEMKRYPEAYEYYRKEYEKSRSFYSALGSLYSFYNLGRHPEVLELANQYLGRFNRNDEIFEITKIQINSLKARGDIQKAAEVLRERLARDPGTSEYRILLGNQYFELRDYPRAEEMYSQVLEYSRNNLVVVYNLGVVSLKTGRVQKALGILEEARALARGKNAELVESVSFQMAQALYRLERYGEAEANIKSVFETYLKRDESRTKKNYSYLWWYANIFSRNEKVMADNDEKNKILGYLDDLIRQRENRELATKAAYLKVVIDPTARVQLATVIRDLGPAEPLAIADLLIYQNNQNQLVALDEISGRTNWKITEKAGFSSPMIHDGKFLAYSLENDFVVLVNEADGSPVLRIKDYARGLHLIEGNLIYLGRELVSVSTGRTNYRIPLGTNQAQAFQANGSFGAVKGKSGFQIFNLVSGEKIGEMASSLPAAGGFGGIYFYQTLALSNKYQVEIFSLREAKVISRFDLNEVTDTRDRFFLQDGAFIRLKSTGSVRALAVQTGTEVWKWDAPAEVTDALQSEGHLYVGSKNGKSYKIRMRDGTQVWEHPLGVGGEGIYTMLVRK